VPARWPDRLGKSICLGSGAIFEGPILLAGGVADGVALAAAQLLGCDLASMGTRFIAARDASDAYRQMLVDSTMDDLILTKAFTGLEASTPRPSIVAAGLDLAKLDESVSQERAKEAFGKKSGGPRCWAEVWSAGHSVSSVHSVWERRS
jgi:nitronate monooxygenase